MFFPYGRGTTRQDRVTATHWAPYPRMEVQFLLLQSIRKVITVLKSCQYCGRIHERSHICLQKEKKIKERQAMRSERNRKIYAFHRSRAWTEKSLDIRKRDGYCCQVCVRGLYDPERMYETERVSVHHIIPVAAGWERRLDDSMLITLCERHHEMAEKGDIPQDELLRIADEQEKKDGCPVCL